MANGESCYHDALRNCTQPVRGGREIKKLKNLFASVPILATPIMG